MNENELQIPDIFRYFNYREFLKDFLEAHKTAKTHITQKHLLSHLKVSSTGFISNLYSGKKNLTQPKVKAMVRALELTAIEAEYFDLLVQFTQSRIYEEKNELFEQLIKVKKSPLATLDQTKFGLFSKWYYVFIREIISFWDFSKGYAQLAKMVTPNISAAEAKEAIQVLSKLNLITTDEKGFYHQSEPAITTGDEVISKDLAEFQVETMELAKRSLHDTPANERDLSVLTMSLSPDGFNLIKKELQFFRKRISRIAMEDQKTNRVYQLNMQLFPGSRKKKV